MKVIKQTNIPLIKLNGAVQNNINVSNELTAGNILLPIPIIASNGKFIKLTYAGITT